MEDWYSLNIECKIYWRVSVFGWIQEVLLCVNSSRLDKKHVQAKRLLKSWSQLEMYFTKSNHLHTPPNESPAVSPACPCSSPACWRARTALQITNRCRGEGVGGHIARANGHREERIPTRAASEWDHLSIYSGSVPLSLNAYVGGNSSYTIKHNTHRRRDINPKLTGLMQADLSDRKQMAQIVYESPLPDASCPVGHQTSRICRRGSRRAGKAVAHFAAHVPLKVSL